jgi:chloramphenicol O-acetyltransferase
MAFFMNGHRNSFPLKWIIYNNKQYFSRAYIFQSLSCLNIRNRARFTSHIKKLVGLDDVKLAYQVITAYSPRAGNWVPEVVVLEKQYIPED